MAPSSPPPPPPCWASRCSWRSPWSLQQFLESPSIFSSNVCMRFNLGYCFWNSDNKQRNYTWCHNLLVNSWWCSCVFILYRPFVNNNIRVRLPFREIIGTSINLSHIRGCKAAHCGNKEPLLLSVSLYVTILLQHLSVTSIESLSKHTKALIAIFIQIRPQNSSFFCFFLG